MKFKFTVISIIVLLFASYWLFKNPQSKNLMSDDENAVAETSNQTLSIAKNNISENSASEKASSEVTGVSSESSDPDAGLRAKGFVDDPENPDQLIKKTQDANGKPVVFYVQKNNSFEPNTVTEKMARENIESKRDLDPAFEIENLKFFDDKNQNDSLLSGSFRNDQHDIEFKITMAYGMKDDTHLDSVRFCFSAPNLKIDVPYGTSADLRTDGSGYGLLKLSEGVFLRLAWSMNPKRKMQAQIVKNVSGRSETLLNFESESINTLSGVTLKRCAYKPKS